jgi:3',5'-cyclic AMP phosphodiesterase CpdA
MSTLTWLHLSDLHFRAETSYDENIVLRALLRDVEERIGRDGLHPDFVAVTGDIAFSGRPDQYTLARSFLDDLLAATGLGKDRLFLVPGNHDVDRSKVSRGAQGIADSLNSREVANDILATHADRQLMLARFEGYAAFVNDYLGGQGSFDDEHYCYVRRLELAGLQVALLGLNSAWVSASDRDRDPGLLLGERQVRAALDQGSGADLKIALLHHPFDWLREFDREDVEPLLADNCDYVLHGHMHQVGLLQARTPDSEVMVIAAGACYETRRYPNAYNWVRLDLRRGRGTVHLRTYSDRRGGFWTKDVLNYRNVPDGVFDFPLPARIGDAAPGVDGGQPLADTVAGRPDTGTRIDTGGGAYVGGGVRIEGGDIVGRDKVEYHLYQVHLAPGAGPSVDDLPAGPVPEGGYNIAAIRNLLRDAFTARELERFCQDRPVFRPLLRNFGPGASLEERIDAVLTYCDTRLLFPELLAEIRDYNPRQYRRYAAQLGGSE